MNDESMVESVILVQRALDIVYVYGSKTELYQRRISLYI